MRIELDIDDDVLRRDAEHSATTCAHTVICPWPAGVDAIVTTTPPSRSTLTVALAIAPLFGPAFLRASAGITVVISPMFDTDGSTIAAKPMPYSRPSLRAASRRARSSS